MFPIVTTLEELLFYSGRLDYLNEWYNGESPSDAHLGDEAGDTGFAPEPLLGEA